MVNNLNLDNLMDGLFGGSNVATIASSQQKGADADCENSGSKIVELSLDEIYDKPNHVFKVNVGSPDWQDFVASISAYGVQTPILVREKPCSLGKYECIAGHCRRAGSRDAGLTSIPAIVTDVDDSIANILMVITNKQRPAWSIAETAHSWFTLYEELKKQGQRTDLMTSRQNVGKSAIAKSAEEQMEALSGKNIRTVQRIIKLVDLSPSLLDLVDTKKMPVNVGYHLSFLSDKNQDAIYQLIESCSIPTPDDAQHLHKMEEDGELNAESAYIYLSTRRQKPQVFRLTEKETKDWFPPSYTGTADDKKDLIRQLLDDYFDNKGMEVY